LILYDYSFYDDFDGILLTLLTTLGVAIEYPAYDVGENNFFLYELFTLCGTEGIELYYFILSTFDCLKESSAYLSIVLYVLSRI